MKKTTEATKPPELGQWAQDLVCPVCFGKLSYSDAAVVCAECGRSYPLVDEIPVLIAGRATEKSSQG